MTSVDQNAKLFPTTVPLVVDWGNNPACYYVLKKSAYLKDDNRKAK